LRMSAASPIAFIAVSRVVDAATLAITFDNAGSKGEKALFETALATLQTRAAHLMYPTWKDRCLCDEEIGAAAGVVWARVDDEGICLMSVGLRMGKEVPERIITKMLCDLSIAVRNTIGEDKLIEATSGSLSNSLKKPMMELKETYKNPMETDKVTEVQEQIEITKVKMHENIHTMMENLTTLEELQVQAQSMSVQAEEFCKVSGTLKRQVWFRNLKVKAITAGCVGAITFYFVLPLMQG